MNIVETIVTYKTAPKEKQLADTFIDEQAAIDFALAIEVSGGVGVVFALAAIVFLYFASTNPAEGIQRALALVIVTCPCVFTTGGGLSTGARFVSNCSFRWVACCLDD